MKDANGNIVCNVSLNPAGAAAFPGCKPLNLFGRGNASPDAVDWVIGPAQPSNRSPLAETSARFWVKVVMFRLGSIAS